MHRPMTAGIRQTHCEMNVQVYMHKIVCQYQARDEHPSHNGKATMVKTGLDHFTLYKQTGTCMKLLRH